MKSNAVTWALAGLIGTTAAHSAAQTYTDQATFDQSLGVSFTDNYSAPGYSVGDEIPPFSPGIVAHSDAQMSAVLGETKYITPRNQNFTGPAVLAGYPTAYCSRCSGSFLLNFNSTTIGTSSGVYGVGFDYYAPDYPAYGPQITLSVTFGDNSTQDILLPFSPTYMGGTAQTSFFALTSNLDIKSINFGGPNGTSDNSIIALTDLTIGAPNPVPLPAAAWMMLSGLGGLGAIARRCKGT